MVEAAKIMNFISKVGLVLVSNNFPSVTYLKWLQMLVLPFLSCNPVLWLPSRGILRIWFDRLFVAESEMIAVEKGLIEKSATLTNLKIAGIFKDIIGKLDEAINFFEDGLKSMSSSSKSNFKQYYIAYCQGMKAYYQVILSKSTIDQLLVLLRNKLWGR